MQRIEAKKKAIHLENAGKWWLHRERPMGWTLFSIGIVLLIVYVLNAHEISDFTVVVAWIFDFVGLGLLGLPDDTIT